MKAAIYVRVANGDPELIEVQKHRVLAFVAKHPDWEASEEYIDTGGFKDIEKRPALNRMMQDAAERRFDVLAVSSLSRLSRDSEQARMMLEHLRQHGVQVSPVNELDREMMRGR